MASITVLSDVILGEHVIRAGVRGRSMRRNSRVRTASGGMQVNILWAQALREYEVGFKPMRTELWQQLEALWEVTYAGAYGFLLKDPKDNSVTTSTGIVKRTNGTYQMFKRYAVGANYVDRKITRPLAGATIYVDGAAEPGATYSTTSGVVNWTESPGGDDTYTWSGSFYVPVHFQNDEIDWELVRPDPDTADRVVAGPACVLEEIRE